MTISLKSFLPRRRWLRFSLATFLVAVALIGYGCKWVLDRVKLCAGQYELVKDITAREDHGFDGTLAITVLYPASGGCYVLAEPSGWEKTVADCLGIAYKADVVTFLPDSRFKDLTKELQLALRLPKLKKLHFSGDTIAPDIVVYLKQMNNLEQVWFSNTNLTASDAEGLKAALPDVHIKVDRSAIVGQNALNIITVADLP